MTATSMALGGGARICVTSGLTGALTETQKGASLAVQEVDLFQAARGTAGGVDDGKDITWSSACKG